MSRERPLVAVVYEFKLQDVLEQSFFADLLGLKSFHKQCPEELSRCYGYWVQSCPLGTPEYDLIGGKSDVCDELNQDKVILIWGWALIQ